MSDKLLEKLDREDVVFHGIKFTIFYTQRKIRASKYGIALFTVSVGDFLDTAKKIVDLLTKNGLLK